jgi:hypothetical protein
MHRYLRGKRLWALIIAAVAATALTSGFTTSAQGGAAKHWKITFVAGDKGDPFYITLDCGAVSEAKKLGATVNMQATWSPGASEGGRRRRGRPSSRRASRRVIDCLLAAGLRVSADAMCGLPPM